MPGSSTQRTICIECVNYFELMFYSEVIVVDIVCRSYFERSRSEFHQNILIKNYRYTAIHHRNDGVFSFQSRISWIFRVHANCSITQNSFRTYSRNGDRFVVIEFLLQGIGIGRIKCFVFIYNHIPHIGQLGLYFLVNYFLITHRGKTGRIPVHHADTTIDISFFVEVDKHIDHRLAQVVFHGETGTVPIAGSTQFLQLFEDDTTVLLLPFPGILQEFIAAEVGFFDPFVLEHLHHFRLGSDGGVICPRHPAGVFTQHTGTADQYILNSIIEHMTHVQYTGHIRRRNHNGIWLPLIWNRAEITFLNPIAVPLRFGGL